MRINGYRCDGCTREHLLDPARVLQYPSEGLPPTWLVVGYGKFEAGVHTFCSKECLTTWLVAQDETSNEGSKP